MTGVKMHARMHRLRDGESDNESEASAYAVYYLLRTEQRSCNTNALRMLIAVIVALAFATALLSYVLWGKSRRRDVELLFPPEATIESLFRSMAALTWGRVMDGNRVTIIQDDAFFIALLDDIKPATHHIHL